jgi:hypothetical protein
LRQKFAGVVQADVSAVGFLERRAAQGTGLRQIACRTPFGVPKRNRSAHHFESHQPVTHAPNDSVFAIFCAPFIEAKAPGGTVFYSSFW